MDVDDLEILYSDNHLVVVNKPPGLLTQPAQGLSAGVENLEDLAREWVEREFDKPGKAFLHAVHRIDAVVGGVVLLARTSKSLSRLQQAQQERRFEKEYLALVEGKVEEPSGTLEHWMRHGSHRALLCKAKHRQAKKARLDYRVLACTEEQSLLRIRLHTGRYHQIRLQLSAWGHPILGDQKYGGESAWEAEGIALQHCLLRFPHPVQEEIIEIQVPQPLQL